jgi:hypothetical protein
MAKHQKPEKPPKVKGKTKFARALTKKSMEREAEVEKGRVEARERRKEEKLARGQELDLEDVGIAPEDAAAEEAVLEEIMQKWNLGPEMPKPEIDSDDDVQE